MFDFVDSYARVERELDRVLASDDPDAFAAWFGRLTPSARQMAAFAALDEEREDEDALLRMLGLGLDPNAIHPDSGTLLELAVDLDMRRAVEAMLRGGADCGLRVEDDTPLTMAAEQCQTWAIELMLQHGAPGADELEEALEAAGCAQCAAVEKLIRAALERV